MVWLATEGLPPSSVSRIAFKGRHYREGVIGNNESISLKMA